MAARRLHGHQEIAHQIMGFRMAGPGHGELFPEPRLEGW
jgi:hypothetical protein